MAFTLFIVEDDLVSKLPQSVRDKMMDEAKRILAFIPKFKVVLSKPAQFPATIDFTDSIVKVVETDDEVGAVHNQVMQRQLSNITAAIKARNIDLKIVPFKRATATPERGGVGWHQKDVISVGGTKLAITQTGGVASMQTVREEILLQFAPNNWTLKEAENRRNSAINKARLAHGKDQEDKTAAANQAYEKSVKHWRKAEQKLESWPADHQEATGIALARLIAHEARHQYLIGHFDEGGLGGDSADIFGLDKSAQFLTDDQSEIRGRIVKLEQDQKAATLQIELLPKGQAFPF